MKKKVNIFLLLFVLGLWGTAGYRYLGQYFKQQNFSGKSGSGSSGYTKIREKDTFALLDLRRDPFLNVVASAAPVPRVRTFSNVAVKKEIPVSALPFPQVKYFGYIKSKQQQKELVLLSIENRLVKLRTGDSEAGLKVMKIYHDSVQVSFGSNVKTLKRKN